MPRLGLVFRLVSLAALVLGCNKQTRERASSAPNELLRFAEVESDANVSGGARGRRHKAKLVAASLNGVFPQNVTTKVGRFSLHDSVAVSFPGAKRFVVFLEEVVHDSGGTRFWHGTGRSGGQLSLTTDSRGVSGSVRIPSIGTYRLTPGPTAADVEVELTSQDSLRWCGNVVGTTRPKGHQAVSSRAQGTVQPVINDPELRILILWTPAVRLAINGGVEAGSDQTIRRYARDLYGELNRALIKSVNFLPFLFYKAEEIQHEESGSIRLDLRNLTAGTSTLAPAHRLRDQVKADVVILLVVAPNDRIGGLANSPPPLDEGDPYPTNHESMAYAVSEWRNAQANALFSHEIAHIFGADHDRAHGGRGLYPYSVGYRTRVDTAHLIDIMSYRTDEEDLIYNVFSNPDIPVTWSDRKVIIGAPDANNARTIGESAQAVANFRIGH